VTDWTPVFLGIIALSVLVMAAIQVGALVYGARLARRTTASTVDDEVKFVCGFSQLQRLTNDHPQGFVGEVAIERFVIDLDFAAAGSQVNSGRCRFAPSRSVILNFSHSNFLYLLLKLL
jgi:hypothetical protein